MQFETLVQCYKYNKTLMCKLILYHFSSIILILVAQTISGPNPHK